MGPAPATDTGMKKNRIKPQLSVTWLVLQTCRRPWYTASSPVYHHPMPTNFHIFDLTSLDSFQMLFLFLCVWPYFFRVVLLVILTKLNLVLNDPVPVVRLLREIWDVPLQPSDGLLEPLLLLLQCMHLIFQLLNLPLGAATQIRLSVLADVRVACSFIIQKNFALDIEL